MKITFSFDSLSDLSKLSDGLELLDILSSSGFIIEKADDCEPIHTLFDPNDFPQMWTYDKPDGEYCSQDFLFKGGTESSFKGVATWSKNLRPNSQCFHGINLWLNVKKDYSINKLLQLGDALFSWSKAEYGYITENIYDPVFGVFNRKQLEKCKYPEYVLRRGGRQSKVAYVSRSNIYDGIADPMWVNYFGKAYCKEPDFRLPENHVTVGHGVRCVLTERPDDERLCEPDFLEHHKKVFGEQWFWQNPKKCGVKIPCFDRSEITRLT
jgi:hypothetical protein